MGHELAGQLILVAATERDVDAVVALYRVCTAALLERGVRQWDAGYPARTTAADAAARGELFLLLERGDVIVGTVILNAVQAPEYAPIEWHEPGPALVVHTLVVDPRRQGAGLGRAAMASCEAFGREHGYVSVRLDAYPGNPSAIALYERLGYDRRGEIQLDWKPAGHQRYAVYEKRL